MKTNNDAMDAFHELNKHEMIEVNYIGNGCEHGFKPAKDCPNRKCMDAICHRHIETIRTALEQSQRDADIIEGLHGTIKSQMQTHDALVKKCRKFEAQAEQDRAAVNGLAETLKDIASVTRSDFEDNPSYWMELCVVAADIGLKTHAAAIKRAGDTHE